MVNRFISGNETWRRDANFTDHSRITISISAVTVTNSGKRFGTSLSGKDPADSDCTGQ